MSEDILFYARALYSYQPVEESEIGFNESDVLSVIEDYNDGWWRAYTETATGRVPANYFEVLANDATEQQGYDYNGTDDQATPQPHTNSSMAASPEYQEQMKCWGDILQSQKDEKQKLEKQIAEMQATLFNIRKEAFYFKQFDFLLQEVLKLETEMDLDLDASIQYQRAQLALARETKTIKESVDGMKLENQHKKHIDEKLDDFNNKINNSMQLLENCDKSRKVFYGDLTALQSFLEDVEKRKKADEDEKAKQKEREVQRGALREQMLHEREEQHNEGDDEEWV